MIGDVHMADNGEFLIVDDAGVAWTLDEILKRVLLRRVHLRIEFLEAGK